jgi:hypothetical protein
MRVPELLPQYSVRVFRILFFLEICIKKYQKVGGQNGQQHRTDCGKTNAPGPVPPVILWGRKNLAPARDR